ncbi:MAG: winged helix-turn-helix transcriptional regulator, partial [Actinobacteria bacterium]|nr:winged helix-turn-helix transcriptional regulator [Actinomycetota bacterium]
MQIKDKSATDAPSSMPGDMRPLFVLHAEMCQALANEHRVAIIYALKDGEKCVGELAA